MNLDDVAKAAQRVLLKDSLYLSHGYRSSVRELVEDAKASGRWRSYNDVFGPWGYKIKTGDLVIFARAGGNPLTGGPGHVERAACDYSHGTLFTLGGNVQNKWVHDARQLFGNRSFVGAIDVATLIGEAAVRFAFDEMESGVSEIPGPKADKRIQWYHAGARRGGSWQAGMPGHEGEGLPTLGGSASDEIPWCASSASRCAYEAWKDICIS